MIQDSERDAEAPGAVVAVIAVVGAGSIGSSFAIVHAAAGREVLLYDADQQAARDALERIRDILEDLAEFDLLASPPLTVAGRIRIASGLGDAVQGASFIHECAPENLDIKRKLTADIDQAAPPDVVIASASSAIPASDYASEVAGRERCLVAHPGNPPFLLRVVEVVPAPFTAERSVDVATSILAGADLTTIVAGKETRGFVFNRLQGALLREAYCLVRDGVATVDDIDALVRDGLGLRWSVIGPFETVDLNTRGGIERHATVLGPAYEAMGRERGQHDPWTSDLVEKVTEQRRSELPLEQWSERVRWRDRELMKLLANRRR